MLKFRSILKPCLAITKFRQNSVLSKYSFVNSDEYRELVNRVIREIGEEDSYTKIVDTRLIDPYNWTTYLNASRRKLLKDPNSIFKNNGDIDRFHSDLEVLISKDNAQCKNLFIDFKEFLFKLLLNSAEKDLNAIITAYKFLKETSDLTIPHQWYPLTRLMKRNIIYHGGPTNSGKTYHALKRLREADPSKGGGLYCGPLRLLALEVYEQLNRQGVYTSLITGQERKEMPGATHTSSTLEMANLQKEYDVAVIDEIQMISDKERGYAWTKALLGLRAREIHVCGGLEAEQVVRSLAESAGDEFQLVKYERLSKLRVEEKSLRGDYSKVQPGDCIVAFSKNDIFSIRREIEETTPYKCAVIYGQLPPETRSTQARLFNEDNTGFDILVASDAIGMGLNLNIRRIIFHTTLKISNNVPCYVDHSAVKQIGGRAGRLSSQYSEGLVTAWQEIDLAYVRAVMQWDIPQITQAGIFPSQDLVDQYSAMLQNMRLAELRAKQTTLATDVDDINELEYKTVAEEVKEVVVIEKTNVKTNDTKNNNNGNINNVKRKSNTTVTSPPSSSLSSCATAVTTTTTTTSSSIDVSNDIRLSTVIDRFVAQSRVDGRYCMSDYRSILVVANWLHTVPLSIEDRFTFANAPCNLRDDFSMHALYKFASNYALNRPVALNVRLSTAMPANLTEFNDLCVRHNILDLYLWLSHRFPKQFIEQEDCITQKTFALQQIEHTLSSRGSHTAVQKRSGHAMNYMKLRTGRVLPTITSPTVRETTDEYLAKIPKHLHCILPKEVVRSFVRPTGNFIKSGSKQQHHYQNNSSSNHNNNIYKANNNNYNRNRVSNIKTSTISTKTTTQKSASSSSLHTANHNRKDTANVNKSQSTKVKNTIKEKASII